LSTTRDQFASEDDQSISGWSLIFTLDQTQTGTTTSLSANNDPSFTGSSVTLTATVTGSPSPSGGTVAFKDGGNTITCSGGNQVLSGGQATCVATFTTQGSHALTAVYSGSGSFGGSTGSLNQFVETPTTTSSGAFCNAGAITMPGQDNTSPYPSVINVTGISNAVATVSVTLGGFSWSPSADAVHLLLVAPSNQAFEFFAASTDASAGNYTFTDTGAPITEAYEEGALSPGTWQPAVYTVPPPPEDVFTPQPPAPAPQVPGSFTVAAPRGDPSAGTFENTFNGATANGAWALFVYDDDGTNAAGSVTGGWCLDITQASGAATTTTVTTAPNPSLTGVGVTVTATVKSGGNPVDSGTVTFTENGQNVAGGPTSPVSVNSSGQASFSTTALPEGDHNILATYNGVANTYALSFGNKIQRVDSTTTSSINSGIISYCNPGTITIPSLSNSTDEGQASPNPSNIFVANAPGTINHVTVTLNGVELSTPYFLTSLLVGPLNTTANSLDFFSDVGGSTPMTSGVNVTLDDPPTAITPYIEVNGVWQGTNSVTVAVGSTVNLGPQASGSGTWSWSGPSYTASTQQVNNIPLNSPSNVYTATFTNAAGVISTETFTITVAPTTITPYIEVNNGAWQGTNSVTVAAGSTVNLGPQPGSGGSWSWAGPNGYESSSRQIDGIPLSVGTNTYVATYINPAGVTSMETFTITVE
jgi:hypothetical protein